MHASNHYRWLVVAVTVINQAVALGIALYCFAIFSIPWLEKFDVSRGELMLAVTLFQIANGFAATFIGPRLDKIPLLWPVMVGYLLYCSGLGLLSITTEYWQIIFIYATFFAVGQLLFGTFVSQMLVNRWFTSDKGLALGISATGTSLGGIVFPLMIAAALSTYSLSTVFQIIAVGAVLVLMPLNYIVLRVQPPSASPTQTESVAEVSPAPDWTTKQILTSRAFWIPMLAILAVSTSFVGIQANLGAYLADLNYPTSFTGQMIAVIAAMMIVGKLMYGKLADNLDHAWILLFMGGLSIIAIVMLMLFSDKVLLLTAAVLLGISSGGLIPIMGVVFVARFGLASFGKVMGLVMLVMIAGSLGPLLAAWIYDFFGSYHYAFIAFIAMTLPPLVLLKWLPPPLESNQ